MLGIPTPWLHQVATTIVVVILITIAYNPILPRITSTRVVSVNIHTTPIFGDKSKKNDDLKKSNDDDVKWWLAVLVVLIGRQGRVSVEEYMWNKTIWMNHWKDFKLDTIIDDWEYNVFFDLLIHWSASFILTYAKFIPHR